MSPQVTTCSMIRESRSSCIAWVGMGKGFRGGWPGSIKPYFDASCKDEVSSLAVEKTLLCSERCMHCDNPLRECPFSANHKHENGAVVIDQDLCFGGAKCKTVCPWEIPQRQSGVGIYLHVLPDYMGNGVMYKCDLCNDRLLEGKQPGCIEACPQKAMLIGPRREIFAQAEERARQLNGHIYGKSENGGTSTLYVSPVPFELISKTIKKGPGRPGMQPSVQRQMAGTDSIGKAVLAAPAVGIVAGAAGALKWLSNRKARLTEGEKKDE